MKRPSFLIAALLLAATVSGPTNAGCTSTRTSTHTFTNCSDGTSAISHRIDSNTFTTTSKGGSATSYTSGNTTYHTGPRGSGTSYRSGDYAQHQWSDGSSGNSLYQGDSARHEWRAGEAGAEIKLSERAAPTADAAAGQARRARYGHIAGDWRAGGRAGPIADPVRQ